MADDSKNKGRRRASAPVNRTPPTVGREAAASSAPQVYDDTVLREVAVAVSIETAEVRKHREKLEAAAMWLRSDRRRPARLPPSKVKVELKTVVGSLTRVLRILEEKPAVLETVGSFAPDPRRFDEALSAVTQLHLWAERAAADGVDVLEQVTFGTGIADDAIAGWLDQMATIYRELTGRSAGFSSDDDEPWGAYGPFARFLDVAQRPVGLSLTAAEYRARFNRLRTSKKKK